MNIIVHHTENQFNIFEHFCSVVNSVHIGRLIEKLLAERAINKAEFGRRIGVTRGNVYNIFERSSIDTELLTRICEELNVDLFEALSSSLKETNPEMDSVASLNHKVTLTMDLECGNSEKAQAFLHKMEEAFKSFQSGENV